MGLFVAVAVSAVTLGLLYGLFGVGLGLTLRASGALNLAYGDLVVLAVYGAVGTAGTTPATLVIAAVIALAVSVLAYLAAYAPLQRLAVAGVGFLPSLGIALLARGAAQSLVPVGSEPTENVLPGPTVLLPGGEHLPAGSWWLLGAAVLAPIAIWLLIHRTGWGSRLRAVGDDAVLAQTTGIPLRSTVAVAYLAAGALGGLTGALYGSVFGQVFTGLGWQGTVKGFAALVLGGVGSIRGALLGGLALGAAEAVTAGYISSTYQSVVSYLLMIIVLVISPRGLATGRQVRAL